MTEFIPPGTRFASPCPRRSRSSAAASCTARAWPTKPGASSNAARRQRHPDPHRPVAQRACRQQRRQSGTGLVGGDARPRQGHRHRSLVRHLRQLAGQLQGLDRPGVDQSGDRRAVSPRLSRNCRSRTCANAACDVVRGLGIDAPGLRDRQLDGRHDRPGLPAAAPGHRAHAHQRVRQRAGAAVLDRDPLAAARSDPPRPELEQRRLRRPNTIPKPACAWRASSAW